MSTRPRLGVALSLILACGTSAGPPEPKGAPPEPREPMPTACASVDLFRASSALALDGHPCRAWVDATHGRVVPAGAAYSGTFVSAAVARGAGFFVSCQHCTGAAEEALVDPEGDPPPAFQVGVPARLAEGRISTASDDHVSRFFFAHRLFSPVPPPSAFDARGRLTRILPRHDFVVATVSGTLIEVTGQLGAIASSQVKDGGIALHDPRGVLASDQASAEARAGAQALLLGYPRNLPERAFDGELVASVGEVLADEVARDRLARAEAEEAAIPYDPEVEFVVAARAVSGMSGGGAFDADGRFLGVMVRGTLAPVDGAYLTRVVRATFIRSELEAALAGAPATLRDRVTPFLPHNSPR